MFINNLKIAFRTLLKFKGYAAINLLGLALGLTAGILIMIYVVDELSFDKFHAKGDRIYRVVTRFYQSDTGAGGTNETNGWPIGKILEQNYPEVEAVLYTRGASSLLINHNDKRIRERVHYASPEFFTMFSFPLTEGNSDRALIDPYSVVISEDMAKKYFPGGDALNKTLLMADTVNMLVTGIMKNIPANSHIQADIIVSFSTFMKLNRDFSYDDGWGNINMRNYVLLKEGADFSSFAAKTQSIYMDRVSDMLKNWGTSASVEYEPLPSLYLTSKSGNGMGPIGSLSRVYLVAGIGIFVILLACINFINLATARAVYRAKEVGLRKVVGSTRQGLIRQFLSESMMLTVFSLIIALLLTGLCLPYFNELLAKNYDILSITNFGIVAGIVVLVFIVAILSGYYPALVLSGMKPVEVLKGKMHTSAKGIQLRRTLVVFQFTISVGLVLGTLVVMDQLNFMHKQALGFDKDQILIVNAARTKSPNPRAYETFKNELKSLSSVSEVSFAGALPGIPGWAGQIAYPEGKEGEGSISVEYLTVDENYVNVLGLQMVSGRPFDLQHEAELAKGLVLNEAAVAAFGWKSAGEAIGKKIDSPSGHPAGEVIGVVKDYHQSGLQQKIKPITMDYAPEFSYLYAVKYKASETSELIPAVEAVWKKIYPGYDYNYLFLDQDFERQYQSESRLANVFGLFAVVTVMIGVIGLIGLVSFMVVARTKEIGVRKILGARTFSVMVILSREFMLLIVAANAIAFPLAWYFSNQWLQTFAYHTDLNPLLFVWTMLIAMGVTLLAVSYQTIRAAMMSPVKAVRYE